jgi:hypothetical protein
VTERELALRREIMAAFATTGAPPEPDDGAMLRSLADQHVVVLDDAGAIVMAHPFAAPGAATTVESGGRTWWGSCAWDGLGLVAALGLAEATVTGNGVTLGIEDGEPADRAVFHVEVPARRWWDDIAYT